MARMAVFPVDLHAGAFRFVDAHALWIDGPAREFLLLRCSFAGFVFRNKTDTFVTHTLVFTPIWTVVLREGLLSAVVAQLQYKNRQ